MSVPRCPNHNCPLTLTTKERGQTTGASPCPISGAMFDWSQSIKDGDVKHDKFGNPLLEFKVTGEDEVVD